ncbi:MAG: sulfatase-like hydrolase/transferase [Rhodocyclaceae bacterium]|jgi:arylsulfatase A-like enzyme/GT2 family glycosyltransferase|nr:sulfatase-like hydrolase/transferase [Rhodocyclaceae bacterium]
MTDPLLPITVLICTHNRVELLARVIESLNGAAAPDGAQVRLFVVANACSDGTHDFLAAYTPPPGGLPLAWIAEPTPGKSHALNRALPLLTDPVIAFVDDDHRVDSQYLAEVAKAARAWPAAGLICGRILPDWDGSEPPWVHDTGPYRIYPLPVPRYDQGAQPLTVDLDGAIPGGGNLVARLEVIRATGPFLTELGPTGHDLGGAEDLEWVRRAMRGGAGLQYAPGIVQHHYVDGARLTLPYLIQKGYQRSKSVMRFKREESGVPLYMWRKVGGYGLRAASATQAAARRFYLVRLASALGEMSGMREGARKRRRRARLPWLMADWCLAAAGVFAVLGFILAAGLAGHRFDDALLPAAGVAMGLALFLMGKSLRDFSQTGPRIRGEVMQRYRLYALFAMGRLGLWAFAISLFVALPGAILALAATLALGKPPPPWWLTASAATVSLIAVSSQQFCSGLVRNPGLVVASWQYRIARLHKLWSRLSPAGVAKAGTALISAVLAVTCALVMALIQRENLEMALALIAFFGAYLATLFAALWQPSPHAGGARSTAPPNLVLIGSDTLRADRIGAQRNGLSLTPRIDELARRAASFSACYVPCARTAPSLISLLTGTWPHNHGVRDNFVSDEETNLETPALPNLLRALGYRTAAVSDWCGADLGKFSFGFDVLDLPDDQWNLKYLIRQGPKDIRLFLSIFLHNRIGRRVLPEVYYLGGVPQTTALGNRGRHLLSRLAASGEPFLLNLFYSTTHPPFASEHPNYLRFAEPTYAGESKFAMARLTEPFEIIRRQGEPREEFDLDQILALYDGCVAQFDDEVGKLMTHLDQSGLADNTIIVLYSDHGMEFFEHGTWGQGNSAEGDFSARVPLLIAAPGIPGGKRVDQVVRSIDLLPTLLDLLKAPSVHCDGISLRPVMDDPSQPLDLKAFNETGIWIARMPGQPPEHLAYPELLDLLDVPDDSTGTLTLKPEYADQVVVAKDRMVRDGKWKLVYRPLEGGMGLSLYNVEIDPGCTHDLSQEKADQVARLWGELAEWMSRDPVMRRHPNWLQPSSPDSAADAPIVSRG